MYRMAVLSMLCDDGNLDVSKSVEHPFKILTGSTTTDSSILDALWWPSFTIWLKPKVCVCMRVSHLFEISHLSSKLEISPQEKVYQKLRNTDLKMWMSLFLAHLRSSYFYPISTGCYAQFRSWYVAQQLSRTSDRISMACTLWEISKYQKW